MRGRGDSLDVVRRATRGRDARRGQRFKSEVWLPNPRYFDGPTSTPKRPRRPVRDRLFKSAKWPWTPVVMTNASCLGGRAARKPGTYSAAERCRRQTTGALSSKVSVRA